MDSIINFLNTPFFLTLLSLTIGGYVLTLLSDRRARKDKIRDKAIELLEETGHDINILTGRLYGQLRSKRIKVGPGTFLTNALGTLFTKRLRNRVLSEAYFNSEKFSRQYDIIIWEFSHLLDCMETLMGEHKIEDVVTGVQDRKKQLSRVWPLESEEFSSEGEQPFRELLSWTDMIYIRTRQMLLTYLKSTLK